MNGVDGVMCLTFARFVNELPHISAGQSILDCDVIALRMCVKPRFIGICASYSDQLRLFLQNDGLCVNK